MSDATYIGVDLKLTGVFNAPGQTVVIAGCFEGEMTAGSVEIAEDAVFEGLVRATEMVISGRSNGVLECRPADSFRAGGNRWRTGYPCFICGCGCRYFRNRKA